MSDRYFEDFTVGDSFRSKSVTFTEASIGQTLAMRDLMADIRAANPLDMAGGSGRSFSASDRSRFLNMLEREVRIAVRQKAARSGD